MLKTGKNPLNQDDDIQFPHEYLNLASMDKTSLAQNLHFFYIQRAHCKISYHFPLTKDEVLAETSGFLTFIFYKFEHKFLTRVTFYFVL